MRHLEQSVCLITEAHTQLVHGGGLIQWRKFKI